MPSPGDPAHPSGHAHEVMTRGNGRNTEKHHGKRCTVLGSCTPEDDAWDVKIAKTRVKLEDGATVILHNDEVQG